MATVTFRGKQGQRSSKILSQEFPFFAMGTGRKVAVRDQEAVRMHRLHYYIIRTVSVVVSQEEWSQSLIFTFNVPSLFSVVGVI